MPQPDQILAPVRWLPVAAAPGAGQMLTVFLWFAVAAVLALSGFYIAAAIRRWAQREETVETFTFQDVRDMRARGQINDKEFAAMRAALLAELDLADADEPSPLADEAFPNDETPPPDDESQPPKGGTPPPIGPAPPTS